MNIVDVAVIVKKIIDVIEKICDFVLKNSKGV